MLFRNHNEGVAMKKENAGDTSRAGDASLCASFRGRELRGFPLPLGDTAGVCAYLSSVQTEVPSSSDQKRKKESGDDRCAMQADKLGSTTAEARLITDCSVGTLRYWNHDTPPNEHDDIPQTLKALRLLAHMQQA
eukprot:GHVU01041758.1.p1 GENE.GHVU01041758.1~~GHVU01041758.1.p1  ORF type:complete len:135 (+),score=17.22 GHVU01041758.1:361-765(+)